MTHRSETQQFKTQLKPPIQNLQTHQIHTFDLYFCFIARNPGWSSSSFNPSLLTTTPRTIMSPFWAWSMGFTSMDLADPDPENPDLPRKPPPQNQQPHHRRPPPYHNPAIQISQKSRTQPKPNSRQPTAWPTKPTTAHHCCMSSTHDSQPPNPTHHQHQE